MFNLKIKITFAFISLILFAALNIYLLFLPMTNILSYEFAAANGILQFLFIGLLSIYFSQKPGDYSGPGKFTPRFKFYSLYIFLFPLIISALVTKLMSSCPFVEGIFFYLIIVLPAHLFGIAAGFASAVIFRKLSYLLFIIIFLLLCISPVIEIYQNPQIYFYNPLIGFFPGTIYDESIRIDFKLISYEFLILIFLIPLVFLSNKAIKRRLYKFLLIIYLIAVPAGFHYLKPYLGYATDIDRIEEILRYEISTEHFIIYYSEKISIDRIENIALHHEFYYDDIYSVLKVKPSQKIQSFLFDSQRQKGEIFGAERADVAKPWLYQIYITADNFDGTLKHEMAHIFSAEFGTTLFKVAENFNPAMIEGLAMAVENDYHDMDVHSFAALASSAGYNLNIPSLFSGFNFFGSTSSLSYVLAGSFIKFLMDEYSVDKVKAVYGDLDFDLHFGKPIENLAYEYREFLKVIEVVLPKDKANYYFGTPPIFKKFCVRFAANQTREAWSLFNEGNFNSAKQMFQSVYQYSGSFESLSGYYRSMIKLKQYDRALELIKNEIKKFENTAYYYNLELNFADLYFLNKRPAEAQNLYQSLMMQKPDNDYYNAAFIRGLFLNKDFGKAFEYIEGGAFDKYSLIQNELKDTLFYEMIPPMIELNKSMNGSYRRFLRNFNRTIDVKDTVSAFANLNLIKYYIENSDYLHARDNIIQGLKYLENPWSHSLTQNLKKVNYFISVGAEVKSFFKIRGYEFAE